MARASAALAFALALAPFVGATASLELADAEGDQDMATLFLGILPVAGPAYDPYDDVCEDPRADVTNVVASATSERVRMTIAVADPAAQVTCQGLPVGLPEMEGYPFVRLALHLETTVGHAPQIVAAYSAHRGNGAFEQCIHYSQIGLRVCSPQDPYVVDFPTTYVASDGSIADLRGKAYRVSGYSIDAYGSWEPNKAKPVIFQDDVGPTPGFPFVVPSSD